mmetsp:Transcript_20506/g.53335  ORF Transcript_20506/g.53335 Transcript_20506/m.53335 type:complete len:133 (-) Transcript_20506:140-538(-)|eukprot:CAMPEP_0182926284 /NCGR_PEP_ID=MMETSP0105_2-20130417/11418_1 /TAXON_ID=81532 ORGANISM="Acanthoeca-like sp., Strain 10tr" /NCGR_SAMPLE_ID=MMETSP0105_2 /ASSEMBLY_ACC=CAM_ASM_000205 /LENGTH=132 /DNA_ID=CAMNT_0025064169 /DNA_START=84 /DNA_END=482 /DNA_ORIENTATION=+
MDDDLIGYGETDIIPEDVKNLRACLSCGLVKTEDQFLRNGCENCEQWLEIAESYENVKEYTSANFKGMAAIVDSRGRDNHGSWVASWLRLDGLKPGVYALSVTGRLPDEIIAKIKASGGAAINRDRSTVAAT